MTAAAAERARLAGRLEHRLQSSILLVREAASRGDLDAVAEFAEELGRRARGLARCCVIGPESALVLHEALSEWMGGAAVWTQTPDGFSVEAAAGHTPPEVVELGEPLVRLLAAEVGAEVVAWAPTSATVRGIPWRP